MLGPIDFWTQPARYVAFVSTNDPQPVGEIGRIVFDCHDPGALASWWQCLLGGVIEHQIEGFFALLQPGSGGPGLLFMKVPEGKTQKNRIHVDLIVADVSEASDRAIGLGATAAAGDLAGPFRWKVLLDPEGNEFCMCPRPPQQSR